MPDPIILARSPDTQHGAYLARTHFKTILKWENVNHIPDSPLYRSASGRSACRPSPAGAACPRHSPRARCTSSWGSWRWRSWRSWRLTCRWCWRTAPPRPPACTPAAPVRPDSEIHQKLKLPCHVFTRYYTILTIFWGRAEREPLTPNTSRDPIGSTKINVIKDQRVLQELL